MECVCVCVRVGVGGRGVVCVRVCVCVWVVWGKEEGGMVSTIEAHFEIH